ncbi:DUF3558 domain-containing protein [Speluncibacter jeojiensis]|uniref:DUF3558 domain-containing protein n=1 Tax=Speluncibacter jeojiensis TaxID=2710754 RepID=A0A9X4M1H7_9ACTN|nr:DUF3558 domain-containing protein [Corynebacteriales bacterium D3-21]
MRHARPLAVSCALITAALASSCSSQTEPVTGTQPAAPSYSAPTTRTPRITDDSGRPQVAFDPCIDLSDAQITQLGYEPASRRKTDFPAGTYTFLSCSFESADYVIGIASGNITYAEEQKKEAGSAATPTTVDGRQAMTIPADEQCTLAMKAGYGIVILTRSARARGTKTSAPPCEGIKDTAAMISRFMPSGT